MSRLLVACGGSGDLVTAISFAATTSPGSVEAAAVRTGQPRVLTTLRPNGPQEGKNTSAGDVAVLATPVWERFALDPRPGPRGPGDLIGLTDSPAGLQITSDTHLPGGFSPLPALSAASQLPVFYLSLAEGVVGLHRQLTSIVRWFEIDTVDLVDTGGDALARGDEPGLVSPALDALLIAAVTTLDCRTRLICAGLGTDGELSDREIHSLMVEIPAESQSRLDARQARSYYEQFSWVPSEASLITLLSAIGLRGTVDVNDDCPPVRMDERTAVAYTFPLRPIAARSRYASAVAASTSFAQADERLRAIGARSEYRAELDRAVSPAPPPPTEPLDIRTAIDRALPCGDYLSVRRLARAAGLNSREGLLYLERLLSQTLGSAYRRPLIGVRATPASIDLEQKWQ
ncbi:DUF1152 domain-containing protein [Streptomyces sp. NPDC019224]|uniref:DUF1152 domain-containing protein n=1 Tax=Streptomyces sp. NPDC019224 TaxID=3154484 RepID=UPI0033F605A5